jgi:hypothetical protein
MARTYAQLTEIGLEPLGIHRHRLRKHRNRRRQRRPYARRNHACQPTNQQSVMADSQFYCKQREPCRDGAESAGADGAQRDPQRPARSSPAAVPTVPAAESTRARAPPATPPAVPPYATSLEPLRSRPSPRCRFCSTHNLLQCQRRQELLGLLHLSGRVRAYVISFFRIKKTLATPALPTAQYGTNCIEHSNTR